MVVAVAVPVYAFYYHARCVLQPLAPLARTGFWMATPGRRRGTDIGNAGTSTTPTSAS